MCLISSVDECKNVNLEPVFDTDKPEVVANLDEDEIAPMMFNEVADEVYDSDTSEPQTDIVETSARKPLKVSNQNIKSNVKNIKLKK